MQASIEQISSSLLRLKVEVASERVNKALQSAFSKIQKKAAIAGFRPGKAPMQIVQKYFASNAVAEAGDELLRTTLPELIREKKIPIIATPTVTDMGEVAMNVPFKFSVDVEILPSFELKSYKGLDFKIHNYDLNDQDVPAALDRLARSYAKTKTGEGELSFDPERSLSFTLSTRSLEQGRDLPEELRFQAEKCETGTRALADWIESEMKGMVAPSKRAIATNPLGFPIEVELHELNELVVPEWTDELAMEVAGKSLGELKASIEERLKKDFAERRRNECLGRVKDHVLKENTFDAPSSLVAQAIANYQEQYLGAKMTRNMDAAAKANLSKALIPVVEPMVRWDILLSRISDAEAIQPEDADYESELAPYLDEQAGANPEQRAKLLASMIERSKDQLSAQIERRKTLDFLLTQNSFVEMDHRFDAVHHDHD